MVEYAIRSITTNPTLITKATEVIRLVDTRSHRTRAFVIPAIYEAEVKELLKRIEYKNWVEEKKKALLDAQRSDRLDEDLMKKGWESIEGYLSEEG